MNKKCLVAGIALCIFGISGAAAEASPDAVIQKQARRPRVGLVLAGGGAKGSAHIGVLKYLEEKGIPIDYIAGTSMGSIIGGLYALGYSPAQLDSIIKAVDWPYYLSNKAERSDRSYLTNYLGDRYPLNVNFGLKEYREANDYETQANANELIERGEIVNAKSGSALSRSIASGIVNGNNLVNLFNDLCIGYQDSMDFRKLPIPYACVATDLLGGREYVIRDGKIAYAMRSSMAIPIFFAPVEYQGRLLVDGGMVNNFPTDVCRQMGADIIIGVELNEGFRADQKDINSMPGLLGQLFKIVTSGRNADNRKLCDVYIRPDVSGYGMMSFDSKSVDSLVNRGYAAAVKFGRELDSIKRIEGEAVKTLQAPRAHTITEEKIRIVGINVEGLDSDEADWLKRKWEIETGKEMSAADLHSRINKFKGTGFYKSVEYYLSDTGDGQVLDLVFAKRPANTFKLGLWADSEEAVALGMHIGGRDNAFSGFKGTVNLRISYNPLAECIVTYSIPGVFDLNLGALVRSSKQYMSETLTSRLVSGRVNLYVSDFYSRHSDVKGGLSYENFSERELSYKTFYGSDGKLSKASVFFDYSYDSRNRGWNATSGLLLNVSARHRFWTDYTDYLTGDKTKPMTALSASAEWSLTPGKGLFTFIPQLYFRQMLRDNCTPEETNQIGGWQAGRYTDIHMPFVGITMTKLVYGKYAVIPRLDLRWNINKVHSLTAACNYLHSPDQKNIGAALKYTLSTPVGPLSADVHWSDMDRTHKWGFGVSFDCYF